MTLVIKIGGAAGISADGLLDDLAARARAGERVVLVHGGSDATTTLQAALGQPAEFITSPSGHTSRRTDRKALETFAMATALLNRQLVEGLLARGVLAFGCSGLDGGLVRAQRKDSVRAVVDGKVRLLRDEWTGRPGPVDAALLSALLERGLLPVIAPLAAGELGEMLNVDGDRLAAVIAAALGCETLLILSNVPGLLADVADPASLLTHVGRDELQRAESVAQGRMRKKVLGAKEALEGGVARVILGDARREAPVTAALAGAGTVLGEVLDEARPANTRGAPTSAVRVRGGRAANADPAPAAAARSDSPTRRDAAPAARGRATTDAPGPRPDRAPEEGTAP